MVGTEDLQLKMVEQLVVSMQEALSEGKRMSTIVSMKLPSQSLYETLALSQPKVGNTYKGRRREENNWSINAKEVIYGAYKKDNTNNDNTF